MTWTHCHSGVHSDATASSRIRSKKRPVAGCASSAEWARVARRWVDAVLMRVVATGTDDEYDDGAGGGSDSGSWNTTLVDSSAGSGH